MAIPVSWRLGETVYHSKSKIAFTTDLLDRLLALHPDKFPKLAENMLFDLFLSTSLDKLSKGKPVYSSGYYRETDFAPIAYLASAYWVFRTCCDLASIEIEGDELVIEYPDDEFGLDDFIFLYAALEEASTRVKPLAFTLLGEAYKFKSHAHISKTVFEKMYELYPEKFSELYMDPDNWRVVLSKDPERVEGFERARQVGDSDYYFDAEFTAYAKNVARIDRMYKQIVSHFGYSEGDFEYQFGN